MKEHRAPHFALLALLLLLLFPARSLRGKESLPSPAKKAATSLEESRYGECEKALREWLAEARKNRDGKSEALCHLRWAELHLEGKRFFQASQEAAEALDLFKAQKESGGEFSSRLALIASASGRNRKQEAYAFLSSLEGRLPEKLPPEGHIDFFLLRGELLREKGELDLAGKNFDEAIKRAIGAQDMLRRIKGLLERALLYGEKREFVKARQDLKEARELMAEREMPYLAARLLEAEADLAVREAESEKALTLLSGSCEIYRLISNESAAGEALLGIAGIYGRQNCWDKSAAACRKALGVFQGAHDARGQITACEKALNLIFFTRDREEYRVLLKALRSAALQAPDDFEKGQAFAIEGRVLMNQKDSPALALEAYQEALKCYRAGSYRQGMMECLKAMGDIHKGAGDYEKALASYQEALSLAPQEPEASPDALSMAGILRALAMLSIQRSQYDRALAYYEKALAADEKAQDTRALIEDLAGIIGISIATFDSERASRDIRRAFKEIGSLKEVPDRAIAYNEIINTIVNAAFRMDELSTADKLISFQDSAASEIIKGIALDETLLSSILEGYREWILHAREKKDPMEEGLATFMTGFFFHVAGRLEQAGDNYQRALAIFEEAKARPFEGLILFLSGQLLIEKGCPGEAIKPLEKALALFRSTGHLDNEVNIQCYLAILHRELKNNEKALHHFEEAAKRAGGSPDKRLQTLALTGMGSTYFSMGSCKEAQQAFLKACALLEKSGEIKKKALTEVSLGRTCLSMGNSREAEACYRRALATFRSLGSVMEERDVVIELGEVLEKTGKESEALPLYREALDKVCEIRERLNPGNKPGGAAMMAPTRRLFEKTIALLIKTQHYDEALKYFNLSGSYELFGDFDPSSITTKDEKLLELLKKMDALKKKMSLLQHDMEKNASTERKDYLSGVLASTKSDFFSVINQIKQKNPDYEQFLALQGPELAGLQPAIPDDTLILEYYPAQESLYLFAVTKDSFSIKQSDISRQALYRLVRNYREEIQRRSPGETGSGGLLYRHLLRPVKEEIEKAKNVEIIPGGLLWYVPFEALSDGQGLLEGKNVGYLYSSHIIKLLTERKKDITGASRLLAYGNPSGADLPFAEKEVEHLGSIFSESTILTGEGATVESFLKEAPQAALIHLATHSILRRDRINESSIQFAGAGKILSLGELYGLTLPAASLVVLSSCESALGEENPGKEFASLASAFTIAGAPSVVASLWRVEDSSTALLFGEFYRALARGHSRSESLRLAKESLRKNPETAAPFYWAGFILLGDWR
ncbi:MAG: CHAT domain-containing protein [Candidatus Eremiobacteraeota bacterium]|nr:CHAT domain-containing protein [Candidatus Eremiobacteraeota bacterium]